MAASLLGHADVGEEPTTADPTSASNPVTTTTTAAPGFGATGPKFGSPASRGKRVATVVSMGGKLPASDRLATILTEHDNVKKYYTSDRQHDLKVLAFEVCFSTLPS